MATKPKKKPEDHKAKGGKDRKKKGGAVPGLRTEDEPVIYRFTLDGKTYEMDVNPDHLPISERIEIEEYLEMPMLEAVWTGWLSSAKASAFMCFMAARKAGDDISLEDVLNSTELLVEEVKDDEDQDSEGKEGEGEDQEETKDDSGGTSEPSGDQP